MRTKPLQNHEYQVLRLFPLRWSNKYHCFITYMGNKHNTFAQSLN